MMEPYNAASAVTRVFMVMGVSVTIPAIASSGTAAVTVAVPGIRPGDVPNITLAANSATPPSNVGPLGQGYCATAGQLSLVFANNNGGLTGNSAQTAIVINVLVTSALP